MFKKIYIYDKNISLYEKVFFNQFSKYLVNNSTIKSGFKINIYPSPPTSLENEEEKKLFNLTCPCISVLALYEPELCCSKPAK